MQGKLTILAAILKLDKPFRPPNIVEMTGVDRQLVRYHLNKMCESGALVKIDKHYVVKDREALLNSLVESADRVDSGLPAPAGFFSKEMTDFGNMKMQCIIAGRTLDLPMSDTARVGYLKRIDDSMKYLKQMRKYLTTATRTEGSAQKYFKKIGGFDPRWMDALWNLYVKEVDADIVVDYPEFEAAYKAAMIESDGTG